MTATKPPGLLRLFWSGLSSLSASHRVWLLSVFATYLAFLALLPPFQTNDEDAHFIRMWTVASGHLTCKPITHAVYDFIVAADPAVRGSKPYQFGRIDNELAVNGSSQLVAPGGAPCIYIPVSYLLPALFARVLNPARDPAKWSHMFWSFYGARTVNWFLATSAILMFLAFAPQLRNLTLLLYSLPMAIHQQVSINQESTILFLGLLLLLLWWMKPSLRQVLWMIGVITVLAATKPIYLTFLLWWLCAIVRWKRTDPERPLGVVLGVASLGLVPIGIWLAWTVFVAGRPENAGYLPSWVNMPMQISYLKANPMVIPKIIWIQFQDLFGRDHLRCGWITVLGVFGWAEVEIGERAYNCLLLAVGLAALADFLAPVDEAPHWSHAPIGGFWWTRLWPLMSVVAILPAITVAMYVQFNGYAASFAMGCTGRYLHLPYFCLFAMSIEPLRRRLRDRRPVVAVQRLGAWLPWVCLVLVWVAEHDAVAAILKRWYGFTP